MICPSMYIRPRELHIMQPARVSCNRVPLNKESSMRTILLVGMLAACMAVCYARYKTSDFTDAGENLLYLSILGISAIMLTHTY